MLVSRLDGPTAEIVRRMISDAVETEKNGLWGRAYVDGAAILEGGLADGDEWLRTVTKDLRGSASRWFTTTSPATFSVGFPMNDCALYYGWYAGGVPDRSPTRVRLRARCDRSAHPFFSANTLRYGRGQLGGAAPRKGATASLGNVYEPYLQLTAHLDIFNDRLLHGFTFAESAYMATRVLSWMDVAVGDPLYRPYASWLQLDSSKAGASRRQLADVSRFRDQKQRRRSRPII